MSATTLEAAVVVWQVSQHQLEILRHALLVRLALPLMDKLVLHALIVSKVPTPLVLAMQAAQSVMQENTRPLRSLLFVVHAHLARPLVVQKDSPHVPLVLQADIQCLQVMVHVLTAQQVRVLRKALMALTHVHFVLLARAQTARWVPFVLLARSAPMLHQAMQVVVIVMLASQRQLAQVLNLHVRHAPQAVARTASQVRCVLRAISASTLLRASAPTRRAAKIYSPQKILTQSYRSFVAGLDRIVHHCEVTYLLFVKYGLKTNPAAEESSLCGEGQAKNGVWKVASSFGSCTVRSSARCA